MPSYRVRRRRRGVPPVNRSHHFNEHHIRANHDQSKRTNHQGNFSKAKVRPVSMLCTVPVPGKFEDQIKVITTSNLEHRQTGAEHSMLRDDLNKKSGSVKKKRLPQHERVPHICGSKIIAVLNPRNSDTTQIFEN